MKGSSLAWALSALGASFFLGGCGGGDGNGVGPSIISNASAAEQSVRTIDNALQGTWVYASANHVTGTSCGVDAHGASETRFSLQFNGSNYISKAEKCAFSSSTGLGTFVQFDLMSGTFNTGGVFVINGNRQYSTLDLQYVETSKKSVVVYLGYNVVSSELRLTRATEGFDGTTPERRENNALEPQQVYLKQ